MSGTERVEGTIQDLSPLGLSEKAQDVYLWLLKNGTQPLSRAAAALGLELDEARSGLRQLVRSHLVTEEGSGIRVTRPRASLESLVERRARELSDELRMVKAVQSDIPVLEAEWRARAAPVGRPADVERIEGPELVNDILLNTVTTATSELCVIHTADPLSDGYVEFAGRIVRRCLNRGVRIKVVARLFSSQDQATLGHLRKMADLGADIRVSCHVPDSLVICDGAHVMVPIESGGLQQGLISVRQPVIAGHYTAFFVKVWNESAELSSETPQPVFHPSSTDRLVLETLARVDKDEIAARQMGVSVRTFRRNVADLLHRLGASNRFQAALIAAKRGWI